MVAVRAASVQPLLDVAVPVLLAVLSVDATGGRPPPGSPTLLTVTALAAVLPLAARRRAPLAVTAVVLAGVLGQVLVSRGAPATFASFVAVMICVYTLVREAAPVAMAAGLALIAAAVTATASCRPATSPSSRSSSSIRSSTSGWPVASAPSCGSGPCGCPRSRAAPRRWRGNCSARRSWPPPRSGPGSPGNCTTSSRTG